MIGSITVNDVNKALPLALEKLARHGVKHTASSVANERPTIEYPGLFVTEYIDPRRCVLVDPVRDANPFFHYLESLWIIAGRNDVAFLKYLLPNMANYSDDGVTFHGAYWQRLRNWNDESLDQIEASIKMLKEKPTSRQVVMSIWNPAFDIGTVTKDMPCNDLLMLKIRNNMLNLTVCNRSNDAVLGCYGANVVQFSMLLMYMAARIGCGVGFYRQVSDSFHVYESDPYWQWYLDMCKQNRLADYYEGTNEFEMYDRLGSANPFNGIGDSGVADAFRSQLDAFFLRTLSSAPQSGFIPVDGSDHPVIQDASRMFNCIGMYRNKDYGGAMVEADSIIASDWRQACLWWLQRRLDKANAAKEGV